MRPAHMLLALIVAAIWGVNFVLIRVALDGFPPLLLTALRFALAASPILVLPKPPVAWPRLAAIASFLFVGQYGFLFVAMANGMPPGLASVALQAQAFFTIFVGAVALGERPSLRQIGGTAVAFVGLALIGATVGGDVSAIGFGLTLAGAASWAVGNILLRRSGGQADPLAIVVWMSLVPPLPMLGLSLAFEGPQAIGAALTSAGLGSWLALGYIAAISTLVAFALWSFLMRRYAAATVAPFSLLVPIFGAVSASVFLGEVFGPVRLAAMALVMLGLGLAALPIERLRRLIGGARRERA